MKKQILKIQLDQLNVIQRFLFNIGNFTNKFLINNFIFDKLKPYMIKILKLIPGSKKILIAFFLQNTNSISQRVLMVNIINNLVKKFYNYLLFYFKFYNQFNLLISLQILIKIK